MSRKLMGVQSVDIQVPRAYLAEARKILEDMRAAGKLLEEDEGDS